MTAVSHQSKMAADLHSENDEEQQPLLRQQQPHRELHVSWQQQQQPRSKARITQRRRRRCCACTPCQLICCSGLLVCLLMLAWPLYVILCLFFRLPPSRFGHVELDLRNETFAVGFDLTAGYGTAAISYRNGSIVDVLKVDGDDEYNEVMSRLSLKSSEHNVPPYWNENNAWDDVWRQLGRDFQKRRGKPASNDVAVLARMLERLQKPTEELVKSLGKLKFAFVTTPPLPALYLEDLVDACDDIGVQMLTRPARFGGGRESRAVIEFNTAYAGNGLGLCTHFKNSTQCYKELDCGYDSRNNLGVLYTREALTTSVGDLCSAESLYWAQSSANFSLGSRHVSSNSEYWDKVKQSLRDGLASYAGRGNRLTSVVSVGESARDHEFANVLREVVSDAQDEGYEPLFYSKHHIFAAARGAAELARRCMLRGNDCTPDLRPKGIKG